MKSPLSDKIEIVIFDVGKTIFDKSIHDKLSDYALQTIGKLRDKNILVGVCTMRGIDWCKDLTHSLMDFYITLSGSYIVVKDEVIFDMQIDDSREFSDCLTYDKNQHYYSTLNVKAKAENCGFLADKFGIVEKPYVITLFDVEKNSLAKFKTKYNVQYWENTKVLSIQHKCASKKIAIDKVLKYYKISTQPLYFGDAPNDLEIFQSYRRCVLVKNGWKGLSEYAYDICPSCSEDGAFVYLNEKYLQE